MFIKPLIISFSLILSLTGLAQSDSQIIKAQIKEAQSITKQWMAKKSEGLTRRDLFEGNPEKAKYIIHGIPSHVKVVNPQNVVYRHYIGSGMPIILETSQLKTGITPYVIINRGYSQEIYEDLVGIFLTTPSTPPHEVGLTNNPNADYIDFTLYPGTPVVQIEPKIFLIPGRPDLPTWLKTLYGEYKRTGRASTQYMELFQRVDERGGVNPTFMKVKIKKYRMNGKTVSL